MAVLILGSGVSGFAVYNYLKAKNIDCFFDDSKIDAFIEKACKIVNET